MFLPRPSPHCQVSAYGRGFFPHDFHMMWKSTPTAYDSVWNRWLTYAPDSVERLRFFTLVLPVADSQNTTEFQKGKRVFPFFVFFVFIYIHRNPQYYYCSKTFDCKTVFTLPKPNLTFPNSGAKIESAHFGCGSNSAGRVRPCQGRCRRFESGLPLHPPRYVSVSDRVIPLALLHILLYM